MPTPVPLPPPEPPPEPGPLPPTPELSPDGLPLCSFPLAATSTASGISVAGDGSTFATTAFVLAATSSADNGLGNRSDLLPPPPPA